MLKECIIGSSLRRRTQEIASPFIVHELLTIPLLDRVWRISQHNIKLPQKATIHEARLLKRISIDNGEIFYAI